MLTSDPVAVPVDNRSPKSMDIASGPAVDDTGDDHGTGHDRYGATVGNSTGPSSSPSTPSASSIQSAATQLAIIADSIGQYRTRVADLAQPFVGTTRDDLVTAIHEAERQLRNAERGLIRAARIAQ